MKSDLYAKMTSHRVYTIKQQKSARPLNFTPIIYNNNNQSFRLTISIVKLAHPLFSFVSFFLFFSLSFIDSRSNHRQFWTITQNFFLSFDNLLIFETLLERMEKMLDNFRAQEEKQEFVAHFRVDVATRRCSIAKNSEWLMLGESSTPTFKGIPTASSRTVLPSMQPRQFRSSGKVNSIDSIGFLLFCGEDRKYFLQLSNRNSRKWKILCCFELLFRTLIVSL